MLTVLYVGKWVPTIFILDVGTRNPHRSVTKTKLRQHNKNSLGPVESLSEAASGKADTESLAWQGTHSVNMSYG